jgi:hypothetical protein
MFIPPAKVARRCAITLDLPALTLRTCIFDPIIAVDARMWKRRRRRNSGAMALSRIKRSVIAGYVHCLPCRYLAEGFSIAKAVISTGYEVSCGIVVSTLETLLNLVLF